MAFLDLFSAKGNASSENVGVHPSGPAMLYTGRCFVTADPPFVASRKGTFVRSSMNTALPLRGGPAAGEGSGAEGHDDDEATEGVGGTAEHIDGPDDAEAAPVVDKPDDAEAAPMVDGPDDAEAAPVETACLRPSEAENPKNLKS